MIKRKCTLSNSLFMVTIDTWALIKEVHSNDAFITCLVLFSCSLVTMQLFKLRDQKAWDESGNKAIHVLVAVDMQVMMKYIIGESALQHHQGIQSTGSPLSNNSKWHTRQLAIGPPTSSQQQSN